MYYHLLCINYYYVSFGFSKNLLLAENVSILEIKSSQNHMILHKLSHCIIYRCFVICYYFCYYYHDLVFAILLLWSWPRFFWYDDDTSLIEIPGSGAACRYDRPNNSGQHRPGPGPMCGEPGHTTCVWLITTVTRDGDAMPGQCWYSVTRVLWVSQYYLGGQYKVVSTLRVPGQYLRKHLSRHVFSYSISGKRIHADCSYRWHKLHHSEYLPVLTISTVHYAS